MYQFGIDENIIDFIIDDSPLKQGLFSPGMHIPIYSSQKLYSEKPDYVVILAWNFAESIMNKHVKYTEKWVDILLFHSQNWRSIK